MSEQLPAGARGSSTILGYNTPIELQTIHATYTEAQLALTLDPLALWIRNEGTWNQVATPSGSSVPTASETTSGVAALATQAQADAGVDDTRIVTPLKLSLVEGCRHLAGTLPSVTYEDSVLEEAIANLREAAQKVGATQNLMHSQGMTQDVNYRTCDDRGCVCGGQEEAEAVAAR